MENEQAAGSSQQTVLKPVRCGCGGEAGFRQDQFGTFTYLDWRVYCKKCGMQTGWSKNKTEAIEAWNIAMSAKKEGAWLWDEEEDKCYCSECGEEDDMSIDGVYMMHDYCPNCGADMRGDHGQERFW